MLFKNSKAFSSFSVNDLGKAKNFYGETLGLKVKETPEGLELHLAGGTMPVVIYPSDDYRGRAYGFEFHRRRHRCGSGRSQEAREGIGRRGHQEANEDWEVSRTLPRPD